MRIKLRVNNPEPGMAVSHEIEVSKIDTVSKVKTIIKEEVGVSENRLRLFGMGKELFDNDILLQHNFGDDVLLQVMIRPVFSVQQVQETKSEGSQDEPPAKKPRLDSSASGSENRKPVESEYFKPGDIVDAVDAQGNHAWFPAKIVSIDHWNPEYHDTESNAETDGLEYWVKYDSQDENEEPGRVRLGELRLRALKKLTNSDLQAGDRVFVNYNFESPTKLGSWYDAIVVEPPQARRKTMKATVIRGDGTDHEDCAVRLDHGIYEIRDRVKVSERDPREKFDDQSIFPTRACAPRCEHCGDEKSAKCKDCGCHRCGGKADIENQIICDECGMSFHLCCLKPPLESIPEDDWYCSDCKRDENEVVRPGESVKNQKFAKSMAAKALAEKKTHWGNGMATAGHSADKLISWVPKFHFGPIRGIEVGMTWKFRIQVSGHGVHRPPVGGISGQTSGPVKGCVSICLAGGYEDDVDNGDVVIFTGSGGRNLKDGNKRCSAQDSDQMLTAYNLSLAINCTGKDNPPPEGATAKDWKKTPPIRVCRTYKGKKHSKYAPDEGVRYDGIYKIQKYWREKGKSGFYVYRFQLARCDPSPAPWTKEGQKRMRELGFDKVLDAKQCPSEVWKQKYQLTAEERGLIKQDKVNKAKWEECLKKLPGVELVFLEEISKTFLCTICQDLVVDPANSPCGHLFCLNCLKKMMKASECGNLCPDCRSEWEEEHKPAINKDLQKALRAFLPGYDGSKSKTKA